MPFLRPGLGRNHEAEGHRRRTVDPPRNQQVGWGKKLWEGGWGIRRMNRVNWLEGRRRGTGEEVRGGGGGGAVSKGGGRIAR